MRIAVLSDGGWGTALALLLLGNGHQVTLWGPFPDYIATMTATRRNDRFLKGVTLPPELALTADLPAAVAGAELLLLAAPSQYARATLSRLAELHLDRSVPLLNVAKGIEVGSLKRMHELCQELLGQRVRYAVLSGPSHAEEVSRGVPTAVVIASRTAALASRLQQVFMNHVFRVYTSDDVIGVELGGALKNVYAIAAGICDGMALGDNTKAALMTRGIAEMARLGVALGGRARTFSGLSGIGDMIVTCSSQHSRNRHVGEELGRGRKLPEIQAAMGMVVAEGVRTCESAWQLAQRLGVDAPIIAEVYAGLYQGKDPRQGLRDLMTRDAKAE